MKVEPRGKFAGVKVHLDAEEVTSLLSRPSGDVLSSSIMEEMVRVLGKSVMKDPSILLERTPAQIAAALEKEEVAAREKKKVLLSGFDWKKVKTKVEVEE